MRQFLGLLYGVYKFPGFCGDSRCGVVAVSPEPLSEEVLEVVEYIVLY